MVSFIVEVKVVDVGGVGVLVDWLVLWVVVVEVMWYVYVLYLNFFVGVVGFVDDGRVVSGCNVENVVYGVVLCVECGMVSQLYFIGGGWFVVVACVDRAGESLMVCGRCW